MNNLYDICIAYFCVNIHFKYTEVKIVMMTDNYVKIVSFRVNQCHWLCFIKSSAQNVLDVQYTSLNGLTRGVLVFGCECFPKNVHVIVMRRM